MKDLRYWTERELRALPERADFLPPSRFDSLVLLPARIGLFKQPRLHPSGYRAMEIVGVIGESDPRVPVCRINGNIDVLRLGGDEDPDWRLDCLPGSGLFHLWSQRCLIVASPLSASMFTVYAAPRRRGD